jgi:hypothetical protein
MEERDINDRAIPDSEMDIDNNRSSPDHILRHQKARLEAFKQSQKESKLTGL